MLQPARSLVWFDLQERFPCHSSLLEAQERTTYLCCSPASRMGRDASEGAQPFPSPCRALLREPPAPVKCVSPVLSAGQWGGRLLASPGETAAAPTATASAGHIKGDTALMGLSMAPGAP